MWNWNQFATGKFLGSAAFIGIDMGKIGANDRMVGICESLQTQAVRGGAVENDEDFNVLSKVLFEFANGRIGVSIVSIPDRVALVHTCNRVQNFGMNPRVVVAGKAAHRFHDPSM